jgi:hypothetical protein
LLVAAGFHPVSPENVGPPATYSGLPPYRIETREINGQRVYLYSDTKDGVIYEGDEAQYQRFTQLAQQQRISNAGAELPQMNEKTARDRGYWGPGPDGTW